ncbi:hypothetical protein B0H10DRAFT_2237055 [Mycena sp. CBHHK59/15]|nr:hypothetical protein B0H10DRAFT_2237055 [Mycena sp. CBHHK59/15]
MDSLPTALLVISSPSLFLSPRPRLSASMPLFGNSSGVNITGGNFYDVAGDMNFHNQQLAIQGSGQEVGHHHSTGSSRHVGVLGEGLPSGAARNVRHAPAGRLVPYNASSRPHMALQSSSDGPPVASQPHRSTYSTLSAALDLPSLSSPRTSNLPRIMGHSFTTPINPTLVSPPSPATFSPPDFRVQSTHRLRHTQYEPATTINGGTFVDIQRNGESGINILHRAVALEALHDSADSFPQPRCHPETRTEMLDELWEWSTESHSETGAEPILWLHGPAGAGKSAIMKTLSQRLQDAGHLGGAFVFKRGHPTRGNAKTLFTTIAYQLALSIPVLKSPISQIVEDNPSVVGRSMDVQIRELILEPCRSLANFQSCIIMIDGLDECEGLHIQQEILRLIGDSFHELASPLRFLIASRPEPHIREVFDGESFHGFYCTFNVEKSFDDVQTYFRTEFARIHCEHRETMATVPGPWPSEELIHRLVDKSSGYFIYASTVIGFIDDKTFGQRSGWQQLKVLLGATLNPRLVL